MRVAEGGRAIKPRVCIGFSGTYTCAAVVPRGLSRGGTGEARATNKTSLTRHKRGWGGGTAPAYMLPLYTSSTITHRHADRQNEHRQANTCMHERTYVFSRRVVYPLGLVTDLHEMVQLVKKLLTGTMDLDTTPAQHRSAKGSLVSSRRSRGSRGIYLFFFLFNSLCSVPSRVCVESSCR